MAKLLKWDQPGEKLYEVGVDQGVLFLQDAQGEYGDGVAWSGLTSVQESPSGAEPTKLYADNGVYLNMYSAEEFGFTIEAYMWPDEFNACNGCAEFAKGAYAQQQARQGFGFAYRTRIGNDSVGDSYGYKLHLVYGCKASPSEAQYETINDSPEANTFSWECTSTPVEMGNGLKPTSHIVIDSTNCTEEKLAQLEEYIYGKAAEGSGQPTQAKMPTPAKVLEILGAVA